MQSGRTLVGRTALRVVDVEHAHVQGCMSFFRIEVGLLHGVQFHIRVHIAGFSLSVVALIPTRRARFRRGTRLYSPQRKIGQKVAGNLEPAPENPGGHAQVRRVSPKERAQEGFNVDRLTSLWTVFGGACVGVR